MKIVYRLNIYRTTAKLNILSIMSSFTTGYKNFTYNNTNDTLLVGCNIRLSFKLGLLNQAGRKTVKYLTLKHLALCLKYYYIVILDTSF